MIIIYFIAYFREIKALTYLHRYASGLILFTHLTGQFYPICIDHELQENKKIRKKDALIISSHYIEIFLNTIFSCMLLKKDYINFNSTLCTMKYCKTPIFTIYVQLKITHLPRGYVAPIQ